MAIMKRDHWRDTGEFSVSEAVAASVSPSDPYSTSGELERLRHQVDRLATVVGVLAEILDERFLLDKDELLRLTDWAFVVVE